METIKLYDGMNCVNEFSEATNGKDFKKVAQEAAEMLGLTFTPTEKVASQVEAPNTPAFVDQESDAQTEIETTEESTESTETAEETVTEETI